MISLGCKFLGSSTVIEERRLWPQRLGALPPAVVRMRYLRPPGLGVTVTLSSNSLLVSSSGLLPRKNSELPSAQKKCSKSDETRPTY